jgi:hypothetical protein
MEEANRGEAQQIRKSSNESVPELTRRSDAFSTELKMN